MMDGVSALLKTKVMNIVKKMSIENLQVFDDWIDCWKKQYNVSSKMVPSRDSVCTDEMAAPWGQPDLQRWRFWLVLLPLWQTFLNIKN